MAILRAYLISSLRYLENKHTSYGFWISSCHLKPVPAAAQLQGAPCIHLSTCRAEAPSIGTSSSELRMVIFSWFLDRKKLQAGTPNSPASPFIKTSHQNLHRALGEQHTSSSCYSLPPYHQPLCSRYSHPVATNRQYWKACGLLSVA